MKPQTFEGSNFAMIGDPEMVGIAGNLPYGSDGRECVTLWRPSWRERLSILLFGRVWVCLLGPIHPLAVFGERDFLSRPDEF